MRVNSKALLLILVMCIAQHVGFSQQPNPLITKADEPMNVECDISIKVITAYK